MAETQIRCEECGVELTPQEVRAVLEDGAPRLCTIHAMEQVPIAEEEEEAL